MRHVLAGLFVLALAGGADAREILSRGDFSFFLDSASFRGRDGQVLYEVSVRIPNSELGFEQKGDGFEAQTKLSIMMEDLSGDRVVEDNEELTFQESVADRVNSSAYGQTIIKRYRLDPGDYELSYAVEDLLAPKRSLVGMMKGKVKTAMVRSLRVQLPEFPDELPSFSDAKFVWSIDRSSDAREKYHPNPPRVYGLYNDSLRVYLELYLPDEMADSPTFQFRTEITDENGEIVVDRGIDIENLTRRDPDEAGVVTFPVLVQEDLARFPAGMYSLYFSFGLEDRTVRRVRGGKFSVSWDIRSWELPRREYLAEARFLLGDDAYEEFALLSKGEQESILETQWKAFDPTPETGENEAYEEFLKRLSYINAHYGDNGPAIFSPRGDIYLRYGPPDELIQDVIPVNKETLSEAIEIVADQYHSMNFSSGGVKLYNRNASRDNVVDPRGLGRIREGDNQGYPYELWLFHGGGEPILKRDEIQQVDIGMRYLFIDKDGYGRYILESSSTISDK